jgi:DNA-directed RNA polymerase beta' subunit
MFDIVKFLSKHSDLTEVTSDRVYLDSQKTKFDSAGLMSEQIFGPVKSYSCSCGRLSVKILNGKTCPHCGVQCTNNDIRYKTFARIRLQFPTIDNLNKKHLQVLTTKHNKNILNPVQFDLFSTSRLFLQYNPKLDKLKLINNYDSENCIPLLITGNFSLYLAIYVINKLYNSKEAEKYLAYFFFDLLVLPPGCRQPFVKDNNSNREIINNSIDEIYIAIIRHKNYKELQDFDFEVKLEEYSKMIISSITNENQVPLEDSDILFYDKISSTFQYYSDLLYQEVLAKISGKEGLVRFSFLGKNIDFSGRAVVIADPSLNTYQVKIPRGMFFKLYTLEYYRYLRLNHGDEWSGININRLLRPIRNSEFDIDVTKNEKFAEFCKHIFDKDTDVRNRLIFLNRQPTLFR